MKLCNSQDGVDQPSNHCMKIIRHPLFQSNSSPWFDLRVFYVRISKFELQDSTTPKYLTLTYIPLGTKTILEVNRARSMAYSGYAITRLGRDRVDNKSEEATFVNTDSIRMTGSVVFKVHDRDKLLLSGELELFDGNDFVGEAKNHGKKWIIKCKSHMSSTKSHSSEVYVAGCFLGKPIILCKTVHQLISSPRKTPGSMGLCSIPENELSYLDINDASSDAWKMPDVKDDKLQESYYYDHGKNYYNHQMVDYMEDGDGELSWFNAGVRMGLGIGLGICVGVGLGVGLLVRTYQSTSSNSKKRLLR